MVFIDLEYFSEVRYMKICERGEKIVFESG